MITRSTRILHLRDEAARSREDELLDATDRDEQRRRRLGAGTASVTLHLLILVVATGVQSRPFARFMATLAMFGAPASSGAATPTSSEEARRKQRSITVAAVPDPFEEARRERAARAAASARAAEAIPPDLGIHLDPHAAMLNLRGFSFDVHKLLTRASKLFPFLTREWTFDPSPAARRRKADSLANPFAPREGARRGTPLVLSDEDLQALIDSAWSRRQRWEPFQPVAALASFYSPDEGRVPKLLREYVTQNGLQPYVDPGIRDPRLWSQLGLVADHEHFLEFVSRYAEEHPSTKATTELLFLLDKLAQASLDALVTLLEIDPARDLRWTREANGGAFYALVSIRGHYSKELKRRGLTSPQAIAAHFDTVRLSLLDTIVRTTPQGYRADDARFLTGEIYWRQGKRAAAREVWRAMLRGEPDDGYAIASAAIRAALAAPTVSRRADPNAPIERALDAERGRWIGASYDRLRRFGYHFDTY